VKIARWIDHLPPWLSFGAILSCGIFSPGELGVMVAPLLAALLVEARRWNLHRHRRILEFAALGIFLAQVFLRIGVVSITVNTLFVLSGIRLSLPREAPQRRQVLLMGFLLFLVTTVATFEMDFLFWALAWALGTCLFLLHHAWESSAALRRTVVFPPPYTRALRWTAAVFLLAGLCFVVLPRHALGLHFLPWGVGGLSGSVAGLSDKVELFDKGPISGNQEVVLRVIPQGELSKERRERFAEAFQLLRGITLEGLDGQRWEALPETQAPYRFSATAYEWEHAEAHPERLAAELFLAPSPMGVIPMPMGMAAPIPPPGMPLRLGFGGSLRWVTPSRRPQPLRLLVDTQFAGGLDSVPRGRRLAKLTDVSQGTEAALAWSRRVAPEEATPSALARRLSTELRSYGYSLDNPSGQAANPLADFLERTRTGHCEYFASALALALRHRGIPARLVNGYRLGPWIEEGGYWLVTQDQAHSWVEYFDSERRAWQFEDPTPSAPLGGLSSQGAWALFQRWTDAVRFRWDRNVVRFSDEDQMAGFAWIATKREALSPWRFGPRERLFLGAALALLLGLRFLLRNPPRWLPKLGSPKGIPALAPLVRKAAKECPALPGETARAWLLRLAAARPALAPELERLAGQVDATAYGGQEDPHIPAFVRGIVRAFRRKRG
jgi:hypothetical protein